MNEEIVEGEMNIGDEQQWDEIDRLIEGPAIYCDPFDENGEVDEAIVVRNYDEDEDEALKMFYITDYKTFLLCGMIDSEVCNIDYLSRNVDYCNEFNEEYVFSHQLIVSEKEYENDNVYVNYRHAMTRFVYTHMVDIQKYVNYDDERIIFVSTTNNVMMEKILKLTCKKCGFTN